MKKNETIISIKPRKDIDKDEWDGAIIFIEESTIALNVDFIENKLILNVLDVEDSNAYGAFSDEDALKVKHFIDSLLDTKKESEMIEILCSCEAGMSRSTAVAASLLLYLNGPDKDIEPIWDNHRFHPNRLIFKKLNAILDPQTALTSIEIDKRIQINRDALSREIRLRKKKSFDKR